LTEVRLPLTGGCFCGACRYELSAPPYLVYACHCTDCQRQSGSAFNMTMPAPAAAFRVTQGQPARFERTTARGRKTVVRFCGACGSRLFAESNPEAVSIRPGTLDDTTWIKPVAQFFSASAHDWALVDGIESHDDQPPDVLSRLIRAWRATAPRFV
jgi:hypothetical protein